MGADGWVCSLVYAVYQMLSLLPCTDTANGAAGHNRGEVAETSPLARTQGRTVGCILDFNCVGPFFCVSFKEPLASTAGNQQAPPAGELLSQESARNTNRVTEPLAGKAQETCATRRQSWEPVETTRFTREEILGIQ